MKNTMLECVSCKEIQWIDDMCFIQNTKKWICFRCFYNIIKGSDIKKMKFSIEELGIK